MRKFISFLIVALLGISTTVAQHGFTIEYAGGGALHTIDLASANKTFVGNTQNSFGAGDFGANHVFYAINSGTNEFYEIDTTNGTTTLIGSITPPANHMWTGMAYDEATGIMYGNSSYGVAAGENSLHIIDVSDGSYTLVGTQTTAKAIGCIAIDGSGQMYGMNLQASAKLYQIDKSNGSVTLVGDIGQGAAGMGHGMDWSNSEQTMYLTTYNSMTFENTLRTVNLTTGATTQVGGLLGMWTGVIAIPGEAGINADFTSDITEVCSGGQVNFTDQSSGAITSWNWTFEGGTPSTSTDQNPTVTYNTTGVFDVTLEVGDGTSTSTLEITDMITVDDIPVQPDQPVGDDNVCGGEEITYTTNSVPMATSYTWEVTPSDAGTITGNGTTGEFISSGTWNGSYTIKVNASNSCGTSIWSTELNCTLNFTPATFFLSGGGSYCEGGQGLELTLDGSETGVDYELYLEGNATGTIVAGTGNPISFGNQTDAGIYTVYGDAADCSTLMFGEAYITIDELPEQSSQPAGEDIVCAGSTFEYQTNPVTGANTYSWTLNPTESGTIIGSGEVIEIEWNSDYSGNASLSVYASNDCGDGATSDELEISVSELPVPEVIGEVTTCLDEENIYSTNENTGSTYNWSVVGGDITSGTGSSEITVLWTTLGDGSVSVLETSSEMCNGYSDTLDVFVDECTFIGDDIESSFKVYPNPASTFVNIDFNLRSNSSAKVIIYNQVGQRVMETEIRNEKLGSNKIDIRSLDNGVYFIKIITSSGTSFDAKLEIVM